LWRLAWSWLLLQLAEAQNQLNATTVCTYPRWDDCTELDGGNGPTGAVVVVRLFSGAMVEEMEMLLYKHGNVKCDMSPGKRWGREAFSCSQMVVRQFG
jgi:hypothetical protein